MVRVNLKQVPERLENYPWEVMLDQEYHWMDQFGNAHWIADMETSYIRNALPFAYHACRALASAWWNFAMVLRGDIAQWTAESTAMRYDDYDVPLVRALREELQRREDATVGT